MLDLDAGTYAAFVWPAFAISAGVLIWMVADSLASAAQARAELKRLGEEEDAG
jgi:heme exporter protein D